MATIEDYAMRKSLLLARARRCSSTPMSCTKCGSGALFVCEDGWECVNCSKVHYYTYTRAPWSR